MIKNTPCIRAMVVIIIMFFLTGCGAPYMTISVDYAPAQISSEYYYFEDNFYPETTFITPERIIVRVGQTTRGFRFFEINVETDEYTGNFTFLEGELLFSLGELTRQKPFVTSWVPLDVPHRGISFLDNNDVRRYFSITLDGSNVFALVEFGEKHLDLFHRNLYGADISGTIQVLITIG